MKMIVWSDQSVNTTIPDDKVLQIVIESPDVFTEFIQEIYKQVKGESGNIIVSEDYIPLELKNISDLIVQLIPFSTNTKELLNRLYTKLRAESVNAEMYNMTQELFASGEKYLFELTKDMSSSLVFERPEDITWLLKGFNVCFENDGMSLVEKLFEYMIAINEYFGKSIFFIVGLRSYISDKESAELYKSVLLNGLTLIDIESHETVLLEQEHRVIIDKDLCII